MWRPIDKVASREGYCAEHEDCRVFNKSTAKWLPVLRREMIETRGRAWSLVVSVVTRWTTTWLSACSVLQSKDALQRVFSSNVGRSELLAARSSGDKKYEKLRDVAGVISQESFWDELSSFLELMVPTIESSLVLQVETALSVKSCIASVGSIKFYPVKMR
jgi:hypothetical protein